MTKRKAGNPFPPELLKSTQWASAEEKSGWGNALIFFIQSGFKAKDFNDRLYRQLSNMFGHIAHYDRGGFYATWFATSALQRKWVQHVLDWIPCGDPEWTWSDLERLLRAWLGTHREEVEKVLRHNLLIERSAVDGEQARREALQGQTHQQFKVAAISSNTGDFGHNQFVMVARDGCAYRVHHIQSNGQWVKGQVFDVPLHNGEPDWFQPQFCVECPERMPDCPADVVAQVWGGEAA